MRDLVDVLDDIRNTTVMEFCEDFNKLQIILNNTNQFVRSFDKIVFDSGNEPYIIEIVARLLKYLRVQNYLDGENKVNKQCATQLRKIMMYMLLNTDVSFRYDLAQDIRVKHLLNSLPQMSKCLLLNCIWGLDLDHFFYEMISYAPLWFSMQFLDQAIVSLKYAKPYEVLERVQSMVCAIYFAICRTDFDWRKIDRNRYVDQQRTLGRMFDFVADLLRYFNTPNVAKFEGWSKLRKHRYFGFVLKHMFSMTSTCMELYFSKPAFEVRSEMGVYELMNDRHVPKEAALQYSQPSENALAKINNCLLNTLETCILHVSIDRFLYWAEIDLFKEGEETVTLQQVIGEAAYRLSENLQANKQFQHSIVRHLTQFAMRPKTLAEKAATMNLGMLMLKIDSAQSVDEQCVYLNEFVGRSDRVFGNAECLETVEQYWPLLDGSHVRLMIEYDTREPIDGELMDEEDLPEERLKLRELILKTVDTLPAKDFHHLATFTLVTFGTKFCRYQQPDMVSKMVELINRVRSTTAPLLQQGSSLTVAGLPNVQQLLFQSPALFYAKLVRSLYDSSATNDQYVDAIVAIIVRHKSIAQHFMREHLEILLTGNFEILRSPLLSQLVRKLYDVALFEQQEFIEQFLLKGIGEAYTTQNFIALHEMLKLAGGVWLPFISTTVKWKDALATQRQLARQTALCLVDIIGGLRYSKWEPATQDVDHITLIAMAIELLEPTLKLLQKLASNEDKQELITKVEKKWPLCEQYYFRKHIYCTPPARDGAGTADRNSAAREEGGATRTQEAVVGEPEAHIPSSFAAFMYQQKLTCSSTDGDIQTFLMQVLPQCTTGEAVALARDDLLRRHVQRAALATVRLPSVQLHGSVRTCAKNYIQCLLQVLLPADADQMHAAERRAEAVRSVVELQQQLQDDNRASMLDTLNGDLTSLYIYVRGLDPTLPELRQLESFLRKIAKPIKQQVGVPANSDTVEDMDTCSAPAPTTAGSATETKRVSEQQ